MYNQTFYSKMFHDDADSCFVLVPCMPLVVVMNTEEQWTFYFCGS